MPAPEYSVLDTDTGGYGQRDLHQLVSVGPLRFVLSFSEAREYTDAAGSLLPVPRGPAWLMGIYSADGVATPLLDLHAWALNSVAIDARTPSPSCRALRLADGADSWAIHVSQAPTVIDLGGLRPETSAENWTSGISETYGGLMPFARAGFRLEGGELALRINWSALAAHLKNELSASALESTKTS